MVIDWWIPIIRVVLLSLLCKEVGGSSLPTPAPSEVPRDTVRAGQRIRMNLRIKNERLTYGETLLSLDSESVLSGERSTKSYQGIQ